jgi:hypothetical protein
MSTYTWYLPKRVILGRVFNESHLQGIAADDARIIPLLNAGQPPVHIIHDASRQGRVEVSIQEMIQAITFLRHPALGINCIYLPQRNRFLEMTIQAVGNVVGAHYYWAYNYTDLLAYLAEHDSSLNFEDYPPLYPV